ASRSESALLVAVIIHVNLLRFIWAVRRCSAGRPLLLAGSGDVDYSPGAGDVVGRDGSGRKAVDVVKRVEEFSGDATESALDGRESSSGGTISSPFFNPIGDVVEQQTPGNSMRLERDVGWVLAIPLAIVSPFCGRFALHAVDRTRQTEDGQPKPEAIRESTWQICFVLFSESPDHRRVVCRMTMEFAEKLRQS
ncbi:hypothetical protein, partial [uncultured Gordonia sp.]|uniref:hypothetical protein n=1 Tax=uncultured Gordonia sp. TaxID=198437 RepID=UPI0026185D12